jgi:phosphate transport system permease protein
MNSVSSASGQPHGESLIAKVKAGLPKRKAAERRFRAYGLGAIILALLVLAILLVDIVGKGYTAFLQTRIAVDVFVDPAVVNAGDANMDDRLRDADYGVLVRQGLAKLFPEVTERGKKRSLGALLSGSAPYELRDKVVADPSLIGQTVSLWLIAGTDVDMFEKGQLGEPGSDSFRLKDEQLGWLSALRDQGRVERHFNTRFFSAGDSREPEQSGIWGAAAGSFFTLLVTLSLSLPMGIAAAIYLEEFAPRNRWTDLIEVNINNLAAVPSIVFGLLGLAVFINFFHLPRSSPLVGGLVLTLMTLPVIIIAGRSALKSVPPSIREAALGVGASSMQTVLHHVLPLAMPGMLTGGIIGMARALGESAPLLMIGMVAFIVDVPKGVLDPATVLPVQIYLWADSPERAFVERTSAAIMVLLAFLILMNGLAVYLRRRFERRW